jgi:chorismate mutase
MTKIDRDAVRVELEQLMQANGGAITPEDVVQAAASSNSALHAWFDWDDTRAAAKYRLEQARHLLKVVNVQITYAATSTVLVPAFVSETNDNGMQHYVRIVDVLSDDERRHALVVATIRRAEAILRNCPEQLCQALADRLAKTLKKL